MLRLILISALGAGMTFAASAEDEIRKAEKAWAEAVVKKDVAALEKIYTPALIYAHSTGNIDDVTRYVTRLKEGKQRYDNVIHESTKVVVYGNAAVAHSIARTIGQNDAGPFNDHLMMMHLWVKQGKTWRLAAHQTTKIP